MSDQPCERCVFVPTPGGECICDGATVLVLDDLDVRNIASTNRHLHYRKRHELTEYWRPLGKRAVLDAYGAADEGQTWHQRVRMVMTFRFPTRHRRDAHNLYQYVVKPLVDGMVDARLIPDDDDAHLIGPDLRRDHERGLPRITVRIEDVA